MNKDSKNHQGQQSDEENDENRRIKVNVLKQIEKRGLQKEYQKQMISEQNQNQKEKVLSIMWQFLIVKQLVYNCAKNRECGNIYNWNGCEMN
ncbi:unnamed protein product [Paramecium sonneborni]|uniref:Uncharacterized protein n=1 Tax=Paramecium sonneborni TaxID=65129 RepID=A0A8S1PRZ2_9CILI|nr:unnamed protein product [Paramecium sonneborni]